MTGHSGARHGEAWFMALPDHGATFAVALPPHDRIPRHIDYASGRPWLLGEWRDEDIVVAEVRTLRAALFGCCPVDEAELTRALEETGNLSGVSEWAMRWPGSFHIVAAEGPTLHVQGTVSGLRRAFHTRTAYTTVAASRADVLADTVDASMDQARLAARLLSPGAPYPLHGMPVWRDVEAVPEDCYLSVAGDEKGRAVRWWNPPAPALSLADGAPVLREALSASVAARTRDGGVVSCDLSGGLDSTPVCFLAARGPSQLVAFTFDSEDPRDDDPYWTRYALQALPEVEQLSVPDDGTSLPFDGIDGAGVAMDEPFLWLEDCASYLEPARRLAGRSRVHLTGHGGDEVLECPPAYLHDLALRRPWLVWDHLRGYRALHRWQLAPSLGALLRRGSFPSWLEGQMPGIADSRTVPGVEDLEWGTSFGLPPWATSQAADAVRTLGRGARPLSARRGRHHALEVIRQSGRDTRLLAWLTGEAGLPTAAPLLDNQVVQACLSVRPQERSTPWRFKPLMARAMDGIVPTAVLERRTKGGGDADDLEYAGLRKHRDELLALTEDSRLAALGLVDPTVWRQACAGSLPPHLSPAALAHTAACERWLRDREANPTPWKTENTGKATP